MSKYYSDCVNIVMSHPIDRSYFSFDIDHFFVDFSFSLILFHLYNGPHNQLLSLCFYCMKNKKKQESIYQCKENAEDNILSQVLQIILLENHRMCTN